MTETGRPFADVLARGAGAGLRRGRSHARRRRRRRRPQARDPRACCASAPPSTPTRSTTDGIDVVEPIDFAYAEKFGYVIKPLVIARDHGDRDRGPRPPGAGPDATGCSPTSPGAKNAVYVQSYALGAVDVLRRRRRHAADRDVGGVRHDRDRAQHLRAQAAGRAAAPAPRRCAASRCCRSRTIRSRYYLRFGVADQPGVLGQLMTILGAHDVSIAQVVQDAVRDAGRDAGRRCGSSCSPTRRARATCAPRSPRSTRCRSCASRAAR